MLVVLPHQTGENDIILLLKCYHIKHPLTDMYCIKVPSLRVCNMTRCNNLLVKDRYHNFKAYFASFMRWYKHPLTHPGITFILPIWTFQTNKSTKVSIIFTQLQAVKLQCYNVILCDMFSYHMSWCCKHICDTMWI